MSAPIRVLIADDHPIFRFGLRALFLAEPDTELVGESGSGEEIVATVTAIPADVVLMDIHMPGMDGFEATRRVLELQPQIGIIILTMLDDDEAVFTAMRAGARGYLVKGTGSDEIIRAVKAIASGEVIFGAAVATRMLRYITEIGQPDSLPERVKIPWDLTSREHEVLMLVAQGLTNATIAERLYLSGKTVRNHVSNIFDKMQVNDRGQAIVRARDAGMGS